MITLTKDIEYSHSFLSYLLAGLQGKFAYLNILARIGTAPSERDDIAALQGEIDLANTWFNDTIEGRPLFELAWKDAVADNASKAFELAKSLAKDLSELAEDLDAILKSNQFNEIGRARTAILLASLGRHSYGRDNYLRCFLALSEKLNDKEEVKRYRSGVRSSEQDVEFTNGLITSFQQYTELPLEYFHTLFGEVVALPGLMRTQLFDLKMLWSVYQGPFSFEIAGIPKDRADQWTHLGLSAIEAGYWEAYNIIPGEALDWIKGGVASHAVAGLWRSWKFPPPEAVRWIQGDFSPADAVDWANEGFSPDEARQLINRGVSHPSLIQK